MTTHHRFSPDLDPRVVALVEELEALAADAHYAPGTKDAYCIARTCDVPIEDVTTAMADFVAALPPPFRWRAQPPILEALEREAARTRLFRRLVYGEVQRGPFEEHPDRAAAWVDALFARLDEDGALWARAIVGVFTGAPITFPSAVLLASPARIVLVFLADED